jgi:hypothetical protein
MELHELVRHFGEMIGDAVVRRLEHRRKVDLVAHRVMEILRERGLEERLLAAPPEQTETPD